MLLCHAHHPTWNVYSRTYNTLYNSGKQYEQKKQKNQPKTLQKPNKKQHTQTHTFRLLFSTYLLRERGRGREGGAQHFANPLIKASQCCHVTSSVTRTVRLTDVVVVLVAEEQSQEEPTFHTNSLSHMNTRTHTRTHTHCRKR